MSLKFIHDQLQHWASYYELMRYAGDIDDAEYDRRIERLVMWARDEIDRQGEVPVPVERSLQELLNATIKL